MKKVKLIFGTTNSQPVGAADAEVEHVYQKSYKPFIRALYNAPHVRATLHYSGQLLQWLERYHSEFIDVLSELVGRKQVELLGGGFYDPIFPLIPRADRLGQIERLTTYLRKLFGKRPRGLWVTRQVWDPMLPSLLKTSGMEYTFLDDYQFDAGGIPAEALHTPCITEDEGKMVIVFPISGHLRGACAHGSIEELRSYLDNVASEEEDRAVSLLCPGESLGDPESSIPGFEESWLRDLFAMLDEESSWLVTATPSRYLKKASPRVRGYFPQAAFDPDRCDQRAEGVAEQRVQPELGAHADGYVPGVSFRSLLTRHAESNLMYAKMHYIHILVNQIRGDKYRKQLAREELWRGQSHSAYWKGGRAGGIFSNRLRKQVYASLIEAEKVTREKGIFSPSIITVDFDMDGLSEFLYQGQEINAYVHKQGGVIFELDYLPAPWNYADSLTVRSESDTTTSYARNLFVDHFFDPERERSEYADGSAADTGLPRERGDFLDRLYSVRQLSKDGHRVHLVAMGNVEGADGLVPVEVHKEYGFDGTTVHVTYRVRNRGQDPLKTSFGCEMNLSLGGNDEDTLRILAGRGSGAGLSRDGGDYVDGVDSLRVYDLEHGVSLVLDYEDKAAVDSFPIQVGTAGADSDVPAYQATSLTPQWSMELAPGQEWTQAVSLSVVAG